MSDRKALAWIGVFDGEPDPEFIWHDEANARRWINTRPGVEMAPLAIAPTLTDEEREAIEVAIRCVDSVRSWKAPLDALREKMIEHAATLRGLLERLG